MRSAYRINERHTEPFLENTYTTAYNQHLRSKNMNNTTPNHENNAAQNKLYITRADKALPILVRQALVGQSITYQNLAQEIGMPNPRNLNMVLGYIGNRLIKLGKESNREIPPINCLVINKDTGLPGKGIGSFITKEDFSRLTKSQKQGEVKRQLSRIFAYRDWYWVLEQFNLKPIKADVKQLLSQVKKYKVGGESPMHKKFKEYIARNPLVLGLTHLEEGKTEYMLPSQDEIDVLFGDGDLKIGIEVKSKASDTADILRGLFQCVKYKYLLEAEQAVNGETPNCRVILVLQNSFPAELVSVKNVLGIEVMDKITITEEAANL
jgi:hypothetical protein